MSSKESTTSVESKKAVKEIDWSSLLSSEDIANLAGFFGVLIEMDLEDKQRNEKGVSNEVTTKNSIKDQPKVS